MIVLDGLTYRYRDSDRLALDGLSLTIERGEFVVLTGPSGCGKSTLALAIGGYLFRQFDGEAHGTVTVDGMDVRTRPIYDVAEVVGLVQQNPETQFCTLTVRDEVAFGLENRRLSRAEIVDKIDWALTIVGAGHLLDRPLASLSGGEKQKVAIAAMMAAKPQVLIFDEPTSNLDPTATAEIFGVIEHIRAKAGITVLVIEHKVEYLRPFQPRLVVMDAGRVAFDGPMPPACDPGSPPSRVAAQASSAPTGAEVLIRARGLEAGYNGHPVLHSVDLEVGPGEFVAVMGDNGSGKSTFLKCLMGLLKPSSGQVQVTGRDTASTPVSSLARQVGLVFQNPDHQLFGESVWQEATLAPRNFGCWDGPTEARVAELLARSGLGDRRDEHPYRLSYGQKRRLNLVSVLSYGPRLILLDEVLIGQDPANAAFLLDLLAEEVARGGAVVMVNHAPGVSRRYASRLLFFQEGRVTIDAPVEQGFAQLQAQGQRAYVH